MKIPPRPEPSHKMKLGDCQYRDCYTLDQLRARELEIIEVCKAVCAELETHYSDCCYITLFNGDIALINSVSGEARACRTIASVIDKLKDQL